MSSAADRGHPARAAVTALAGAGIRPKDHLPRPHAHLAPTQVFTGEVESKQTLCPRCGKPAGEGKFCTNCGAPLGMIECSKCGAKNPAGTRFCGECGTKLG